VLGMRSAIRLRLTICSNVLSFLVSSYSAHSRLYTKSRILQLSGICSTKTDQIFRDEEERKKEQEKLKLERW
jgi:hypothetical protein